MPMPAAFDGKLTLPVIAAPMFLVSGTELVIEACRAGVVGTFPALNARPIEKFDQWCDDQLITPGCIQIQQLAAQVLQLPGFFRQYLLDAVRQ